MPRSFLLNLFILMSYRYKYPVRKYYSRSYRSNKYSNETIAFNTQLTSTIDGNITFPVLEGHNGIPIVSATDILGNRKAKNFTIKVTANGNEDQIFGALVYVPEGTWPSNMQVGGTTQSIYEPNQNVICTFIIPPNAFRDGNGYIESISAPTQITVSNKLARNLNTGDLIALVFSSPNGMTAGNGLSPGEGQPPNPEPVTISGTVNFAIKY